MMRWIEETTQSLSQDHTDIGTSVSSAEINKQAFHNFQSQIAVRNRCSFTINCITFTFIMAESVSGDKSCYNSGRETDSITSLCTGCDAGR